MSTVLVDSSVLLDLFTDDARWAEWSEDTLARYGETHSLYIDCVVYAEVSLAFAHREELDEALAGCGVVLGELPRDALFEAARAFLAYRRRGGPRTAPLPDFFIGAHAQVQGWELITRDPARIRSYFPGVSLVTPE